jgi:Tol biopolymer transport system component
MVGNQMVKTLAYCAERNGNFDIYTITLMEEKKKIDNI